MSEIKVNKLTPRTNCGTVTLGDSGDTIALGAGATQTGFGRTGTVDWDTTPKTATFTAVSGDGFFCNTTSGGFTANLPAGVAGAIVSFADYAGTWQTGNLTVSPNGSDKIGGTNADVVLNTEGQSVTFVFADSTQGWINVQDSTSNVRGSEFVSATGGTETTCGNCKIHTFTGPGTFAVCSTAVCAANNVVSYLVVAGGGSGGTPYGHPGGYAAGGGGAGGFREAKSPVTPYTASPLDGYPSAPNRVTVTATSFPITVGAGGTSQPYDGPQGPNYNPTAANNGSNSVFSTITSAGGGGAGTGCNAAPCNSGRSGGSGGGAGASPGASGGAGNTPPTTPAQGQSGATGVNNNQTAGGGGGGAGAAGTAGAPGAAGGAGGNGVATSITGSSVTRAGGGGGGSGYPGGTAGSAGTGGSGGGGTGNNSSPSVGGGAGTVNTGSGGGGGGSQYDNSNAKRGGAGGSGIVVIRYKFQ
jgi:hypothetical protein